MAGGRQTGLASQPCTGERERVTIQVDRDTLAKVDKLARDRGISRSAYMVSLAQRATSEPHSA